jgi:deferrochelatase/peroxidase EfeB
MNPRDSTAATMVDATNHRILRRAATYGPALPEGVLDDDGVDRGIVISFIGADLTRQFEFLKSVWANDGNFTGLSTEKDPLAGNNVGTGTFTIPKRPIRRRLQQLPRFVATTGGEYLFMPGIRALNWLAERPS